MYRTIENGALRLADAGKSVTVCGWAAKVRNLGGILFIDLRDRSGMVQLTAKPESAAYQTLSEVKNEYVITVTGIVRERESKNPNLPTGDIEIVVEKATILSASAQPPLLVQDKTDALEDLRMKYRYLDLRRPVMQKNLWLRSKIAHAARNYFDEQGFLEIETPILARSTPEGARDYLVPSRVHPGEYYALPQSPQLYKQMLMVAGLEKYYQLARCFRDEDLRLDRQPEFTQIDFEESFIDEADIYPLVEGLVARIMKEAMGLTITTPFPRLTWDEAEDRYGIDKPDTRFGLELVKLNDILKDSTFTVFKEALSDRHGLIKGLTVPSGAAKYSRKEIDRLTELVKTNNGKGLIWLKLTDGILSGSIVKVTSEREKDALIKALSLTDGDLAFIVADKKGAATNQALAALRNTLGRELGLTDPDTYNYVWITDFPSFEWSEEDGRWVAAHHPFTSPKDEWKDKLLTDPEHCYSKCYDLVLNGFELGSGSIRIHEQEVQDLMFEAVGLTKNQIEQKFGWFANGLRYGTPPHGGMALGLDRIAFLLAHADSLRDVIAFPKTTAAIDPLTETPNSVDDRQLRELHLPTKDEQK